MTSRTCYLMVRDIEGQGEDEAALEWGVEFGLEEGEALPEDHEDLTEAQYTIYKMMKALQGTFDEMGAKEIVGDEPSGLVLPN